MLSGSLIVARDLAHAKLRADLEAGKPLPDYFKNHPIYYAGPAKTPRAMPPARSARPRRAAWTPSSTSSRRRAAAT
jgi:fumarate hydratase, class I